MNSAKPTIIFILGMHRSGTSALSGALNLLGANHGSSLMSASEDNEKGYWEHSDIVAAHDQLLEDLSLSWDSTRSLPENWLDLPVTGRARQRLIDVCRSEFSDPGIHCIKDPRMCRFLPLWQEIANEVGFSSQYVLILRPPGEVAESIFKRDGLSIETAMYLWGMHIFDIAKFISDKSNFILTYENLLEDPVSELNGLLSSLELDGLKQPDKKILADFLSPDLRHHISSDDRQHPALDSLNSIYLDLGRIRKIEKDSDFLKHAPLVMPLLREIETQRQQFQDVVSGDTNLEAYLLKDKYVLGSKLARDLDDSRNYSTELLSENERLTEYNQSLSASIEEKEENLLSLEKAMNDSIEEKDDYIEDLKRSTDEKDRFIEDMAVSIAQKDDFVADLEQTMLKKDQIFAELEKHLQAKEEELIKTTETLLADIENLTGQKDEEVNSLQAVLTEKDEYINSLQTHFESTRTSLAQLEKNYQEHEQSSEIYAESLRVNIQTLTEQSDRLFSNIRQIADLIEAYDKKKFTLPGSFRKAREEIKVILGISESADIPLDQASDRTK